jgi:uncharacterized protein YdeI (YjbR/CyaY-like superfamily)
LKPVFFQSAAELQLWMQKHHENAEELWVGFYKKRSGRPSITYAEAVDEALCCGWIDGVRHGIDEAAYKVRFTPRKPKSQWSTINIGRMQALIEAGRVKPAGLRRFEGAKNQPRTYSYEQRSEARLSPADQRRFRANRSAWSFFQAQPPWYRRTSIFWVASAKKAETRQKRLAILIQDSAKGKTIAPLTRKSAAGKRR